MKKYILSCTLILCSIFVIAQEEEKVEHDSILDAAPWGSEFFTFPISFAPAIPYQGYEEAVFPPGWSNEESPEFWSYVFAWKIDAATPLTTEDFETNLSLYFDGLMDIQNRKNGSTILATTAAITRDDTIESIQEYTGTLYLYEGRYTNKMMTLYTLAEQYYYKKEKQTTVIFRFSPASFDADIWKSLKGVTLHNDNCD